MSEQSKQQYEDSSDDLDSSALNSKRNSDLSSSSSLVIEATSLKMKASPISTSSHQDHSQLRSPLPQVQYSPTASSSNLPGNDSIANSDVIIEDRGVSHQSSVRLGLGVISSEHESMIAVNSQRKPLQSKIRIKTKRTIINNQFADDMNDDIDFDDDLDDGRVLTTTTNDVTPNKANNITTNKFNKISTSGKAIPIKVFSVEF